MDTSQFFHIDPLLLKLLFIERKNEILLKISLLSSICQGKYEAISIPNLTNLFLINEKY